MGTHLIMNYVSFTNESVLRGHGAPLLLLRLLNITYTYRVNWSSSSSGGSSVLSLLQTPSRRFFEVTPIQFSHSIYTSRAGRRRQHTHIFTNLLSNCQWLIYPLAQQSNDVALIASDNWNVDKQRLLDLNILGFYCKNALLSLGISLVFFRIYRYYLSIIPLMPVNQLYKFHQIYLHRHTVNLWAVIIVSKVVHVSSTWSEEQTFNTSVYVVDNSEN